MDKVVPWRFGVIGNERVNSSHIFLGPQSWLSVRDYHFKFLRVRCVKYEENLVTLMATPGSRVTPTNG